MSPLLAFGLANALCAAILAIPAYLVSRYSRRPALAHALWLLVLVKLITPPLLRPGLAWLPAAAETVPPTVSSTTPVSFVFDLPQVAKPAGPNQPPPPPVTGGPVPLTVPVSRPDPDSSPLPSTPSLDGVETNLMSLVLLVWVAGALVCLGRASLHVVRFHGLLRHVRRAPAELQDQADELAGRMGLGRAPELWLVPGPLPPMVWGLGQARILFPEGLLDRLDRDERASLLIHELAHVCRRDHWVRWLELVVLTLFWWYPLAWWARRQLHAREEECCDAWAADLVPPRTYAAAILETVDFLAEERPRLPAVASALAGVQSLRERLTLILTAKVPRRLNVFARFLLVLLAAGVLPLMPTLVRAARPEGVSGDSVPSVTFTTAPIEIVARADDVHSLCISPDGQQVAASFGSAERPGGVEVYDVPTGQAIRRLAEPLGVAAVRFSMDGKTLSWSEWTGQARVRDLGTWGDRFGFAVGTRPTRVSYSPDGKWLASASTRMGLALFETLTGNQVASFPIHRVGVQCLGFSERSTLLAAGGLDLAPGGVNGLLVFDVANRKQVARLAGHTRAVTGVAFAPRDTLIATASADRSVRIWDGKTFALRTVLRGHSSAVKGVAFSPNGKLLATGGHDRTIRLWNPLDGREISRLVGHPGAIREIVFSRDGRFLVSGGTKRTIKVWDVLERREIRTLGAPRSPGPLVGRTTTASPPRPSP